MGAQALEHPSRTGQSVQYLVGEAPGRPLHGQLPRRPPRETLVAGPVCRRTDELEQVHDLVVRKSYVELGDGALGQERRVAVPAVGDAPPDRPHEEVLLAVHPGLAVAGQPAHRGRGQDGGGLERLDRRLVERQHRDVRVRRICQSQQRVHQLA